jgi:hypothetical protein
MKINLSKIGVCRGNNIALFIAGFIVIVLAITTCSDAFAAGRAGRVEAYGMLTSVEVDGTVIIDNMGYLVSPSAVVRNYRDEYLRLRDISLPHNVYFEYEYTEKGFMIVLIKEVAG